MKPGKVKTDKYKQARSGATKIFSISCAKCNTFVLRYQKDGHGALLRMYLDRILDSGFKSDNLSCPNCGVLLAVKMLYAKEQRPAYRIIPGRMVKRIAS